LTKKCNKCGQDFSCGSAGLWCPDCKPEIIKSQATERQKKKRLRDKYVEERYKSYLWILYLAIEDCDGFEDCLTCTIAQYCHKVNLELFNCVTTGVV
jgi:hypothetical protein